MTDRLAELLKRGAGLAVDAAKVAPSTARALTKLAELATSPQLTAPVHRRRAGTPSRGDDKRREQLKAELTDAGAQLEKCPRLIKETYRRNLAIAQDRTGRRALEALGDLPMSQQLTIVRAFAAVAPQVEAGRAWSITREDVAAAAALPGDFGELVDDVLPRVRTVAASPWGRRVIASAWASWTHAIKLSRAARAAGRGGIYTVEGYCAEALGWLVPRADESPHSRSTLFGRDGSFMVLGAESRRLGHNERGARGMSLYTRYQPNAQAPGVRYIGPYHDNGNRYALAVHRYDRSMTGRTARSLASRARGGVRALARLLVEELTPWVQIRRDRPSRKKRRSEPTSAPRDWRDREGTGRESLGELLAGWATAPPPALV